MSPIRIPEGFVFIPREAGVSVALELLEAADQVGADRKADVRTITGGYHVAEEVAKQFQENRGNVVEDEGDHDSDDDDGAGEPEAPSESWTHDQLNEFAAKLEPALELTSSTPAKAEKVKLIEEHIAKNKTSD